MASYILEYKNVKNVRSLDMAFRANDMSAGIISPVIPGRMLGVKTTGYNVEVGVVEDNWAVGMQK